MWQWILHYQYDGKSYSKSYETKRQAMKAARRLENAIGYSDIEILQCEDEQLGSYEDLTNWEE